MKCVTPARAGGSSREPAPIQKPIAAERTPSIRSVATRTNRQHGIWFSFVDANGLGYCQPDVLLGLDGQVVVLECKLTEVDEARKQLAYLYLPVVAKALGKPTKGIVVVRHLTRESNPSNVCTSLGEALKRATSEYYPTLHWIGRGPI